MKAIDKIDSIILDGFIWTGRIFAALLLVGLWVSPFVWLWLKFRRS